MGAASGLENSDPIPLDQESPIALLHSGGNFWVSFNNTSQDNLVKINSEGELQESYSTPRLFGLSDTPAGLYGLAVLSNEAFEDVEMGIIKIRGSGSTEVIKSLGKSSCRGLSCDGEFLYTRRDEEMVKLSLSGEAKGGLILDQEYAEYISGLAHDGLHLWAPTVRIRDGAAHPFLIKFSTSGILKQVSKLPFEPKGIAFTDDTLHALTSDSIRKVSTSPPTPSAKIKTSNANVNVGDEFKLVASELSAGNRFTSIREIEWNLGNGVKKSGEKITHTYQESGEYDISLQIENEYGGRYKTSTTISVKAETTTDSVATTSTESKKPDNTSIQKDNTVGAQDSADGSLPGIGVGGAIATIMGTAYGLTQWNSGENE